jgi:arsenate reductase
MSDLTLDPITRQHVQRAAAALEDEFAGVFSKETIERYIADSTDLLGDANVSVFVPVLVHRFTRERLKALAQAEGKITKEMPEVLFVCVHNAAAARWPPVSSSSAPAAASTCARRAAHRPTRSTPPSSRR